MGKKAWIKNALSFNVGFITIKYSLDLIEFHVL